MRRGTLLAALIVTVATSAAQAQSFNRVAGDFNVGTSPVSVATGDFNNDTQIDIVAANNDSGDVSILLNTGGGNFQDGVPFPIGAPDLAAPSAVAVAEFNGDTKPDIVVADENGNSVAVLLNQGGGVFSDPIIADTGSSPEAIAVGDFNGDGKLDVAAANYLDDTVSILLGQGNGHLVAAAFCSNQSTQSCTLDADCGAGNTCDPLAFCSTAHSQACRLAAPGTCSVTTSEKCKVDSDCPSVAPPGQAEICVDDCPSSGTCMPNIPVGFAPAGIATAKLDADGNLDLAVSNSAGGATAIGTLTILKGRGDGHFDAQPTEITSTSFDVPVSITAVDLDNNSKVDLVVVNEEGDSVSVLLGNGDLSFQTATRYDVAGLPESAVVADFDGDHKLDIASSGSFEDKVSVLIGIGDGTFTPAVDFIVGGAPFGIAADDFNKDTKIDVVSANTEDNTVSVLLNTTGEATPTPTPTATSLTPTPTPTATGKPCVGDCDGHNTVTVDEILTMVNIALNSGSVLPCLAGDANHDTKITVDEILTAVNNALTGGCS